MALLTLDVDDRDAALLESNSPDGHPSRIQLHAVVSDKTPDPLPRYTVKAPRGTIETTIEKGQAVAVVLLRTAQAARGVARDEELEAPPRPGEAADRTSDRLSYTGTIDSPFLVSIFLDEPDFDRIERRILVAGLPARVTLSFKAASDQVWRTDVIGDLAITWSLVWPLSRKAAR